MNTEHVEPEPGPAGEASPEAAEAVVVPKVDKSWGNMPERGSMLALKTLVWLYRTLGRRGCSIVLYGMGVYFTLLVPSARRASRIYLDTLWATPEGRRALGRPPGLRLVIRHVHEFAVNIFDRIVAWSGNMAEI